MHTHRQRTAPRAAPERESRHTVPPRMVALGVTVTGAQAPHHARLIELAGRELIDGVPGSEAFHAFLDPGHPLPWHTLQEQHEAGRPDAVPVFSSVVDDWLQWLGDSPLLLTREDFVLPVLRGELHRVGRRPPAGGCLDLRRLGLEEQGYLSRVVRRFGLVDQPRGSGAVQSADLLAEVYRRGCGGPLIK